MILLTRLAATRMLHRCHLQLGRIGPKRNGSSATGTPRRVHPLLLLLFLVFFLWQGIHVSTRLVHKLVDATEQSAEGSSATALSLPEVADLDSLAAHSLLFPKADRWVTPGAEPEMLGGLAIVLLTLFLGLFFATAGNANQDLGRVEWSLEWLFTFPVRARSLFLAQLLEHTLLHPFSWFVCGPLFFTIYWSSGMGGWSIPAAIAATLMMNTCLAVVRVPGEIWLRKSFALSTLKNIQAACTVLGLVTLYVVFYLALAQDLPHWFRHTASAAGALAWLPPALPLWWTSTAMAPWIPCSLVAVGATLLLVTSARGSEALVGGGLLRAGGAYQGSRRDESPGQVPRSLSPLGRGILGKEIQLLLRDRSFFVQTLIVPFLVIGFQFFFNRSTIQASATDWRHGATFAFSVGAYCLIFGGSSALSVEAKSLWLLYTFPQRLSSMFREKATLWAVVGSFYVLVTLAIVLWSEQVEISWNDAGSIAMALIGIVIYAFIAVGMGILGTNPLDQNVQRRLKVGSIYLYMMLASMYCYGIYAPQMWQKFVLLVLCSLLAYAIWQKVNDHCPYLMDPSSSPTPRIALSDGLIAVLAFFVIQAMSMVLLEALHMRRGVAQSLGGRMTLSFVVAGSVVTLASLVTFWRRGVADLRGSLGLSWPPSLRSLGATITAGFGGGLMAALVAVSYLLLLTMVPALQPWREELLEFTARNPGPGRLWFAIMAIGAAPLFEEFLFRGLVYGGLRRTFPKLTAAIASAAVFAVVHPPLGFLPVFSLGLVTAWIYERTGRLLTPILAHMTYNTIVVILSG